ncbi:MAG: hypothetical protein KME25_25035 [Symplocastrum torsivum CPER-KK1]|uniref:Uncharacterized protein n=1 Tax=Symplocastrum torsivum CPER-KK1 TaxID=450513 RepID=A0A951UBP7_9CYAN|nr:hypothetical protein [Microcoleus sp. FACHB-SPT15]MBD1803940.1 hypothetical protein [Microcoleus sp. FACHB-SPT15]MBW4547678.1 hypothetical protein [Symplocastrum torsivum CPER-KK1]
MNKKLYVSFPSEWCPASDQLETPTCCSQPIVLPIKILARMGWDFYAKFQENGTQA